MGQSCDTENKSCCNEKTADCGGSSASCECPLEMSIEMNKKAFCAALQGVQVDIMKEKIRSAWGEKIEKEADAVLEAMGTVWKSKIASAKAEVKLRETLKESFARKVKIKMMRNNLLLLRIFFWRRTPIWGS